MASSIVSLFRVFIGALLEEHRTKTEQDARSRKFFADGFEACAPHTFYGTVIMWREKIM